METTVSLIKRLKQRILASRYVVAKIANAESLMLYYQIGNDIENEVKSGSWGDKMLDEISARLQQELPGLRGFSAGNLKKMRIFYNAWKDSILIGSSVTAQLQHEQILIGSTVSNQLEKAENEFGSSVKTQIEKVQNQIGSTLSNQLQNADLKSFLSISFSHHFDILTKVESESDRLYYIEQTAQNFWSVRYLRTELNNQSHLQAHKMPNNFTETMSAQLSNKAIRAFRDFSKPMGVATYKTTEKLPAELQKALPDAETLKKLMG